jgi:hypothetical protein
LAFRTYLTAVGCHLKLAERETQPGADPLVA